jgi:hypothetical protein
MLSPWFSLVFGLGSIVGLLLLVKSIKKLVSIYNSPFQLAIPVVNTTSNFEIKNPANMRSL